MGITGGVCTIWKFITLFLNVFRRVHLSIVEKKIENAFNINNKIKYWVF